MTNWRQILSWRNPDLEGFEEGNPPYSQDPDYDDGHFHYYSIPYVQDEYGHFWMVARCKREAKDRYQNGLDRGDNYESDDYDNMRVYWNDAEDEGRTAD